MLNIIINQIKHNTIAVICNDGVVKYTKKIKWSVSWMKIHTFRMKKTLPEFMD